MSPSPSMTTLAPPRRSHSVSPTARAALVACAVFLVGITACSNPQPADTTGADAPAAGAGDTTQSQPDAPEAQENPASVAVAPTTSASGGVAEGATENDTQVIAFNPSTFGTGTDTITPPDSLGSCEASGVLPRPNAYSCTTEAGARHDPCFVIAAFNYQSSSGSQLGCSPDPISGSWGAIVRVNGALPEIPAPALDPIVFFVSLGSAYPGCERIEPKRPLGAETISFQCKAPGAVLVDDINTSVSPFTAQYVTTDSAGTTITSGPELTPVETAWVL